MTRAELLAFLRTGMEAAWSVGYDDAHKGPFMYEVGVLLGHGASQTKKFSASDHEMADDFMVFTLSVADHPDHGRATTVEVFRIRPDHIAWIGRTSSLDRV